MSLNWGIWLWAKLTTLEFSCLQGQDEWMFLISLPAISQLVDFISATERLYLPIYFFQMAKIKAIEEK